MFTENCLYSIFNISSEINILAEKMMYKVNQCHVFKISNYKYSKEQKLFSG